MKIRDFTTARITTEEGSGRLQMLFNTDKPSLNEVELRELIDLLEDYYNVLVMHNQQKRFQS